MRITKSLMDQFLPTVKGIMGTDVPDATVLGAEEIIIGRLRAAKFPVELWTSAANTPDLVEVVIAMWAAGTYYNATFSEVDASTNNYGFRLIRRAQELLDLIAAGTLSIDNVVPDTIKSAGGLVTEPVFTMGDIF